MSALDDLRTRLIAARSLGADEVLALRRTMWPDGMISDREADKLFALNDAAEAPSPAWVDLFVEALSHYVVHQQAPRGYVDDAKADWLVSRIAADGRIDSLAELELLVKVLERATNAPASLKTFALAEIERAVVHGEGPTQNGGALSAGCVTSAEVALLRRAMYAQCGDGPASIGQSEAELLFRLKDATLGADNAPEWDDFFVRAVGSHLMAYVSYTPLERAEAGRLEAFLDDTSVRPGRFLERAIRALGDGSARAEFARALASEPAEPSHAEQVAAANAVTTAEREWLNAEIASDGARDPLEEKLLAFLATETAARR
jgi:hypothetical protein